MGKIIINIFIKNLNDENLERLENNSNLECFENSQKNFVDQENFQNQQNLKFFKKMKNGKKSITIDLDCLEESN